MSKQLPERPNLDHLRSQAKELLSSFRAGDLAAAERFSAALPGFNGLGRDPALHDAQSALAREFGLKSWADLVHEVERINAARGITPEVGNLFVAQALTDRYQRCQRLIELYPGLPRYSPAAALVSGETEVVRDLLTTSDDFLTTKLAPNEWLPLEYVCYSHLHKLSPVRYEALIESARLLLDAGANPSTSHPWNGDPKTPLSVLYGAAGDAEHIGIVKLLLQRGANPNDGESIYHAAEHDRQDILELLLQHGGDISSRSDRWSNTPLFFLAGYRPTDPGWKTAMKGIRWLLEHGADPNVPCYANDETVLHCACRTGNADLAALLLKHGADPFAKRTDGVTPFELAATTGNAGAMRALSEAKGSTPLDAYERLISACAADMIESAQEHLAALPELKDRLASEGGKALVKFAELGVTAGVRNLLALGVDVASTGEDGATALHFACFCGWADCVDLLLAHGAPLEVCDTQYNGNPLGWTIQATGWHRNPNADYVRIVKSLLAAGADPDQIRRVIDRDEDFAERLAELAPLVNGGR